MEINISNIQQFLLLFLSTFPTTSSAAKLWRSPFLISCTIIALQDDFLFPKSTNYNFGSVGKTMIAVENPPTNASNIGRGLAPVCAGARKKERNHYEEQQPDQCSPGS